jgi:hypothetical protein
MLLVLCFVRVVNPKSIEEQPQVPFGFAQGKLSTPFPTEDVANSAQDDSFVLMRTFETRP